MSSINLPGQDLGSVVGKAPIDGIQYGRESGAWTEIDVQEALNNDISYHRKNETWIAVPIQDDAPIDGIEYTRRDGAWVVSDAHKTRPVYGTMAITQQDINDSLPNQISIIAHPSGTDTLNPPATPVVAGPGPFDGFYKVAGFAAEGSFKEIVYGNNELIVQNDGGLYHSSWLVRIQAFH